MADCLVPDWPAPENVRALQTLRTGGISQAPWNSLNLGNHVGDNPENVAANREALRAMLPAEPLWLTQVHGVKALDAEKPDASREADAIYTHRPGVVCAVMTADCLPVLLCDRSGSVVAAVHAGWRGLVAGVIESTIASMNVPGRELLAWLGPAIGNRSFEVGDEVRQVFVDRDTKAEGAFVVHSAGKWMADIFQLARLRLVSADVTAVYGGGFCTVADSRRFFSFRRDGVTGRMASLIWLDDHSGV